MIVLIYGCGIRLRMRYQIFSICLLLRMWNLSLHALSNIFYMFIFTDVESKIYNIADANLYNLISTVKLF